MTRAVGEDSICVAQKILTEDELKNCTCALDLIVGCDAIVAAMVSVQDGIADDGIQNSALGDETKSVCSASTEVGLEEGGRLAAPAAGDPQRQTWVRSLSIYLARIKELIYDEVVVRNNGNGDKPSRSFPFLFQICHLLTLESPNLLPKLVGLMPAIPFEGRKNIAAIFNFLLLTPDVSEMFGNYTLQHYHEIMHPLFQGIMASEDHHHLSTSVAVSPDTSLLCGTMLRSTLKHEALYRKLLDSSNHQGEGSGEQQQPQLTIDETSSSLPQTSTAQQLISCREIYLYPLMDRQVFVSNFDLASDALTTLSEIFTGNTAIAAEFLERDYDTVFTKFNGMLQSTSYVTKRMSLKLLGEILLNRKYVILATSNLQKIQRCIIIYYLCWIPDSVNSIFP
jgi:hypothetical protein